MDRRGRSRNAFGGLGLRGNPVPADTGSLLALALAAAVVVRGVDVVVVIDAGAGAGVCGCVLLLTCGCEYVCASVCSCACVRVRVAAKSGVLAAEGTEEEDRVEASEVVDRALSWSVCAVMAAFAGFSCHRTTPCKFKLRLSAVSLPIVAVVVAAACVASKGETCKPDKCSATGTEAGIEAEAAADPDKASASGTDRAAEAEAAKGETATDAALARGSGIEN